MIGSFPYLRSFPQSSNFSNWSLIAFLQLFKSGSQQGLHTCHLVDGFPLIYGSFFPPCYLVNVLRHLSCSSWEALDLGNCNHVCFYVPPPPGISYPLVIRSRLDSIQLSCLLERPSHGRLSRSSLHQEAHILSLCGVMNGQCSQVSSPIHLLPLAPPLAST